MFEVSVKVILILALRGHLDNSAIKSKSNYSLTTTTSLLHSPNATGSQTTSSLLSTKSTVLTSYHSILVFNFQNLTLNPFLVNFNGK